MTAPHRLLALTLLCFGLIACSTVDPTATVGSVCTDSRDCSATTICLWPVGQEASTCKDNRAEPLYCDAYRGCPDRQTCRYIPDQTFGACLYTCQQDSDCPLYGGSDCWDTCSEGTCSTACQ